MLGVPGRGRASGKLWWLSLRARMAVGWLRVNLWPLAIAPLIFALVTATHAMVEPTPPLENRRRWPRGVDELVVVEPAPDHNSEPTVEMGLGAVADVQDSLLVAMNDLQRLEGLLDHAAANLLERFSTLEQALHALERDHPEAEALREPLKQTLLELQFHDMATQLLVHTGKVLKGCAYRLAAEAMEPDEEETGVVMSYLPERPNPVTQSEMDAGSVDLF